MSIELTSFAKRNVNEKRSKITTFKITHACAYIKRKFEPIEEKVVRRK